AVQLDKLRHAAALHHRQQTLDLLRQIFQQALVDPLAHGRRSDAFIRVQCASWLILSLGTSCLRGLSPPAEPVDGLEPLQPVWLGSAVLAGLTGRIASDAGAASPGGDTFQVARWQDPFTSGDFGLATPYTSAVEGRGGGPSRCPAGGRADGRAGGRADSRAGGRAGGCARARAGCSVGGHAQWRDQSSPAGYIFGR